MKSTPINNNALSTDSRLTGFGGTLHALSLCELALSLTTEATRLSRNVRGCRKSIPTLDIAHRDVPPIVLS